MPRENVAFFRRQTDQDIAERLSVETASVNDLPSLTQQSFVQEADINYIAKMFGLNADSKLPLPPEALDARYYGDLSEIDVDLQTAMNRVRDAEDHFMRLPATLREKFGHSPAVLWEYLQDPRNYTEAVELGILVRPAEAPEIVTKAPLADSSEKV